MENNIKNKEISLIKQIKKSFKKYISADEDIKT